MSIIIRHLTPDDISLIEALSAMFGEAFKDRVREDVLHFDLAVDRKQ
ncbi:MAG: hypothetical protein ACKVQK_03560 [Burkholderiales bacterium]